ncbi:UNVERIFIED_CONTAM: hypothetical protein K2H54_019371 [Gekko kuhli]
MMLSMTYSPSLRSITSKYHSDWGLHEVRQTDVVELQRLREVRVAAQARTREEFLRMHGLSLEECTAQKTGMRYRGIWSPCCESQWFGYLSHFAAKQILLSFFVGSTIPLEETIRPMGETEHVLCHVTDIELWNDAAHPPGEVQEGYHFVRGIQNG